MTTQGTIVTSSSSGSTMTTQGTIVISSSSRSISTSAPLSLTAISHSDGQTNTSVTSFTPFSTTAPSSDSGQSPSRERSTRLPSGAIVAIVIAPCLTLILIIGALWLWRRRKNAFRETVIDVYPQQELDHRRGISISRDSHFPTSIKGNSSRLDPGSYSSTAATRESPPQSLDDNYTNSMSARFIQVLEQDQYQSGTGAAGSQRNRTLPKPVVDDLPPGYSP
ncbi:hypothetical protein M422DRAFT_57122 [Sphaerobolus stellatus SS14]|uniref:Uncharacterized protein n=1 Tax=Sphaerobolus stellatus (strain SS14) TaxID=990650 RepID=A0A0C9U0Y4_SPHS4|nr:hypothetical protein M422DRAFT_57122 [Sphaerobolus stellatus SS14]